jgi:hypothetical protein
MIKIRVKPLLFAITLAGLSSPVLANNIVTVPSLTGGFIVGGSALYFVPGPISNTIYGAQVNNILNANVIMDERLIPSETRIIGGPIGYVHALEADPNYSWGFTLHLGYVLPCTGNDVMFNWNHLNTGKTAEVIGGGLNRNLNISVPNSNLLVNANRTGTYIVPFVGSVTPLRGLSPELGNTAPYSAAFGRSSTQWSSVDLNFGQHLNIGGNFDLRMAAGLVWARINNELEVVYTGLATNISNNNQTAQGTTTVTTETDKQNSVTWMNEESTFRGFGPEIGFDGHYCITNTNFGLTGHLGGQMLIGSVDTDLSYATANTGQRSIANTLSVGGVVTQSTTNIVGRNADYFSNSVHDGKTNRLVPEVDANIGIDYTYHFINRCASDCSSSFVVELGYQATKYFNALNAFDRIGGDINSFANIAPDTPLPSVITNPPVHATSLRSEDAFFHGPFLSVKFFA